ncbi:MAG: hypothetical protein M1822_010171 [Bathelium mastoideum]|nr:MAG: hypothetical protein M1822_010171 [Bathelium mastoideum]
MTTAVVSAPATAPLAPPVLEASSMPASRSYAAIAPSSSSAASSAASSLRSADRPSQVMASRPSPPSAEKSRRSSPREEMLSPSNVRNGAPIIKVKKEPSPEMTTPRRRPQNLDLSKGMAESHARAGRPSAPLTSSKESAGLGTQELGIACLSPGFQTQDPAMREQLQRSLDVREQQRQIIEARQKGTKGSQEIHGEASSGKNVPPGTAKGPGTSRRKGPPPGLSINAPHHAAFANERVIQSAPLNQSFTGLRQPGHPLHSRHVANQNSMLSSSSHIHHVPANQTNNRLPPIADVFAGDNLAAPRTAHPHSNSSPGNSSHSNQAPAPISSPGFPPSASAQQSQQAPTSRPREYKSAEEAVQSMTGGREDLLPRIVHYGGHQPPTPPSPLPSASRDATASKPHPRIAEAHREHERYQNSQAESRPRMSETARRRARDEYERDNGSPPLGTGRQERRVGPFGEGRDSPDAQRRKKEEFMTLCARAWDLFHS